jgi:hypothetical protein
LVTFERIGSLERLFGPVLNMVKIYLTHQTFPAKVVIWTAQTALQRL